MNENEIYVVKEHKFYNPLIIEIVSIIDKCFRDCHNTCFYNFNYEYIYDFKLTNITNIEINNLTFSGKGMNLYELKKISSS